MRIGAPRALALSSLVIVGAVLGLAAPAQAHNYLVSSTPEDGSTITELPEVFSVTTNGSLLVLDGTTQGFALEVRDEGGLYYGDGCVTVDGPTMSAPAALGPAGDYTMLWQLVSADGHTVSGEVGFTWAPASGIEPSAGSDTPAGCGGAVNAEPPTSPPVVRQDAQLGDVLWIGGAVLAVLLAVGVTFFVVTRRRR